MSTENTARFDWRTTVVIYGFTDSLEKLVSLYKSGHVLVNCHFGLIANMCVLFLKTFNERIFVFENFLIYAITKYWLQRNIHIISR